MRRILSVAVLSGLLSIAPMCLAQRGGGYGGGHAGGGHFAGGSFGAHFGGGIGTYHGGFVSGPGQIPTGAPGVMGSAPRINVGTPHFVTPYNAPLYSGARPEYQGAWNGGGGNRGGDRDHDHNRYRNGYGAYGYGYGIPYVNSWEVLPWDLGYSDFSDQSDTDQNGEYVQASPSDAQQQMDQGAGSEQGQGYAGQEYQGPPPPPADYGYDSAQMQPPEPPLPAREPQLALVFKDGHTEEIRNFVLTPNAVIVMDQAASGREMRIPLTEVNVAATEKAAEQQGLDFSPPA